MKRLLLRAREEVWGALLSLAARCFGAESRVSRWLEEPWSRSWWALRNFEKEQAQR